MQLEGTELADVLRRLRRVQGQVGGIVRMLQEGRDCAAVVTQMAAVSQALDRAGFKIIASGMQQCTTEADVQVRRLNEAELERLFLSLA